MEPLITEEPDEDTIYAQAQLAADRAGLESYRSRLNEADNPVSRLWFSMAVSLKKRDVEFWEDELKIIPSDSADTASAGSSNQVSLPN